MNGRKDLNIMIAKTEQEIEALKKWAKLLLKLGKR